MARSPAVGTIELVDGDLRHALTVLRLAPGDRLIGLDGVGGAWPLIVSKRQARALEFEVAGDPEHQARPGAPGAALPWIEVAVAFPRTAPSEEMLGRLTQLGVAAITPLSAARAQRPASSELGGRHERWVRILREACKQSGRSWLPVLRSAEEPAALARRSLGALLVLDPRAEHGVSTWVDDHRDESVWTWTAERPLVVAVGPEGGFEDRELEQLVAAGAERVRLGPHILRIETAAEVALAVLAERLVTRPRS